MSQSWLPGVTVVFSIVLSSASQMKMMRSESLDFAERDRSMTLNRDDLENASLHLLQHFKEQLDQDLLQTICGTRLDLPYSVLPFLMNTEAELYAFDSGSDDEMKTNSAYWRQHFASRLNRIKGRSSHSLPAFSWDHPDVQCDLMMVDGWHDPAAAVSDLHNFAKVASATHLLALAGNQPTQVWHELVQQGCLQDRGEVKVGENHHLILGSYVPCHLWPQIGSKGYSLMEISAHWQQRN